MSAFRGMRFIDKIVYLVATIAMINLGLAEVLNFNLVDWIFNLFMISNYSIWVYGIIGLLGIYSIYKIWN